MPTLTMHTTSILVLATGSAQATAFSYNVFTKNCIWFWNWNLPACKSFAEWPTAPANCPPGYPHAQVPWDTTKFKWPGTCKSFPNKSGAVYPTGCTKSTPKSTKFTLACPSTAAGQISDGQIQCNSPYPAQEVATGSASFVTSTYTLVNGSLYDQSGRGCEISSGNQLQCNALVNGATAMTGFAVDTSSNLVWQGENTWYLCNIGTSSSYGQIVFTGTHEEFSGVSAATSDNNVNCIAARLGVTYTS